MNGIFNPQFWLEASERAIKTGAQSVLLAWGLGDQVANLFAFDWMIGVGAFGGGIILSLLTSVAGAPLSGTHSPSLVQPRSPTPGRAAG